MNFRFSKDSVHVSASAEPEKREQNTEALLARARAAIDMWKDVAFLKTIEGRLGIDGTKESARRLSVWGGKNQWKRAAREGAAAVARLLDLETVEQILTLSEKEQHKIKKLDVVLEGVMLKIAWEEARLQRIPDAIEATHILEDALGNDWKSTHNALVHSLRSRHGEYADAVTFVGTDLVTRVLAVSRDVHLPITELLKDEEYPQYQFVKTMEAARVPGSEVMKKTAKESASATAFVEHVSKATRRPVVYICNARGGTLFGYTVDSIDTQLARQIKNSAQIDVFWKEVRNKIDHRINEEDRQNTAILYVADRWMKEGRLQDLTISVMSMKIPSSTGYRGKTDDRLLNPVAKAAIKLGIPIVFADVSQRKRPKSSERLEAIAEAHAPEYQFKHVRSTKKDALSGIDTTKPFIISINPATDRASGWWDDHPHFLGHRADRYTGEYEQRDVLVLEVGGHLVFVSEKIENTIKLLDVDSKGEHWFGRNFDGHLANGGEKPKPGSLRYIELYRAWVPFETDTSGKAILDKDGFVIIRPDATFVDNKDRDYIVGHAAVRSILNNT